MSDRCRLEITMLESDREDFELIFNGEKPEVPQIWDESEIHGGIFTGVIYEANYACYTELEWVASRSFIKFLGHHTSGDTYDAMNFVCDIEAGEVVYITTNINGLIQVSLNLNKKTQVILVID